MHRTVLLFDDNGLAVTILAECLQLLMPDLTAHTASHAAEALSKASAHHYDVILFNASSSRLNEAGLLSALGELCPEAVLISLLPMQLQADDLPVHTDIEEVMKLVRMALGPFNRGGRRHPHRSAS